QSSAPTLADRAGVCSGGKIVVSMTGGAIGCVGWSLKPGSRSENAPEQETARNHVFAPRREIDSGGIALKKVWIALCALLAMGTVVSATAGATKIKSFQKWPAGASPQEIGTRVAERFIATPHLGYGR